MKREHAFIFVIGKLEDMSVFGDYGCIFYFYSCHMSFWIHRTIPLGRTFSLSLGLFMYQQLHPTSFQLSLLFLISPPSIFNNQTIKNTGCNQGFLNLIRCSVTMATCFYILPGLLGIILYFSNLFNMFFAIPVHTIVWKLKRKIESCIQTEGC